MSIVIGRWELTKNGCHVPLSAVQPEMVGYGMSRTIFRHIEDRDLYVEIDIVDVDFGTGKVKFECAVGRRTGGCSTFSVYATQGVDSYGQVVNRILRGC